MCNMFIMKREILDAYASWLFPLLEVADARIDYTGLTPYQARAIGRLSECLLDPWLQHNGISYREAPMVSLESTNWFAKGAAFLAAKYFGRTYKRSF